MSEINVTPFVDVMLVLLIVFMITAPLLTTGVAVDLPKTQARKIKGDEQPLTLSVNADGKIFIQKDQVPKAELISRLQAAAKNDKNQRIYVKGDQAINYGRMMEVVAALNVAGFRRVALVTAPLSKAFMPEEKTQKAKAKKPAISKPAAKKAAPKKASPKRAAPKKASPKKASPQKAAPKKAAPKRAAPKSPKTSQTSKTSK